MIKKDGDELLERLKRKKEKGEPLTREDLAGLAMTPVMGSKKTKTERILEAAQLIRDEPGEAPQKVLAMLYGFAGMKDHSSYG